MVDAQRPGSALPSFPYEIDPSPNPDRTAIWPPPSNAIQRHLARTPAEDEDLRSTMSNTMRSTGSFGCLTGRAHPSIRALHTGGPLHAGLGSAVLQEYENHGAQVPAPFERGFLETAGAKAVAAEAAAMIGAQLERVRFDVATNRFVLTHELLFNTLSSEAFLDTAEAEATCEEVGKAFCMLNDLRVEKRLRPLGISLDGYTSGLHRDTKTELSKARAQRVEALVKRQVQLPKLLCISPRIRITSLPAVPCRHPPSCRINCPPATPCPRQIHASMPLGGTADGAWGVSCAELISNLSHRPPAASHISHPASCLLHPASHLPAPPSTARLLPPISLSVSLCRRRRP